jgi:16S rRNA processing protein RimM
MTKLKNPVLLAVIGAAHGIKGEVRVKTFTGDPLALAGYGPLHAKDGRTFLVTAIRPANTVVVVRFQGVNDRNQAEALNGVELFTDRSALQPEEEGEFFHDDLVGLAVRDETGATVAKVTAVQNFGGGDILELKLADGKEVLIPFTHAAVPEVDVAGGFVRVDTVAAGLVDDEDGDGAPDRGPLGQPGKFSVKSRPRGPKDAGGNR